MKIFLEDKKEFWWKIILRKQQTTLFKRNVKENLNLNWNRSKTFFWWMLVDTDFVYYFYNFPIFEGVVLIAISIINLINLKIQTVVKTELGSHRMRDNTKTIWFLIDLFKVNLMAKFIKNDSSALNNIFYRSFINKPLNMTSKRIRWYK